jgi:uncharacterized protein (DUF302 family)
MTRARIAAATLAGSLLASPAALAGPDGMIMMKSEHDVGTTIDRLESTLESKGLTIFKRVDHAANAAGVDLDLRPTQVLIFGNPKLGTPLMQANRTVAIDLPQKALAYADGEGQVWLAYNDPRHLAERHDIPRDHPVISKIAGALKAFARQATGR